MNLITKCRILLRRNLPKYVLVYIRSRRNNYKRLLDVPISGEGLENGTCFVSFNGRRYYGYESNTVESLYYTSNKQSIKKINPYVTKNNIGTVLNFAKRFYFPLHFPTELNKVSYPNKLDGDIFEVGAFLGLHAAHLAHKYTNNNIFAFEASSENANIAGKTLGQYPNAELCNLAVSSTAGKFYFSRETQQLGSLITDSFGVNGSGEYVECVKLDDFCLLRNINKVAIIRIQVNGFEREVINGAWNVIVNNLPILIITSKYIERHETRELLGTLEALGYAYQKFGGTYVFKIRRTC